jgi:hypothetical protein
MGNWEIFIWGHCVSKKYEKFGVGTLGAQGKLHKLGAIKRKADERNIEQMEHLSTWNVGEKP